jgi:hypothetical protein
MHTRTHTDTHTNTDTHTHTHARTYTHLGQPPLALHRRALPVHVGQEVLCKKEPLGFVPLSQEAVVGVLAQPPYCVGVGLVARVRREEGGRADGVLEKRGGGRRQHGRMASQETALECQSTANASCRLLPYIRLPVRQQPSRQPFTVRRGPEDGRQRPACRPQTQTHTLPAAICTVVAHATTHRTAQHRTARTRCTAADPGRCSPRRTWSRRPALCRRARESWRPRRH